VFKTDNHVITFIQHLVIKDILIENYHVVNGRLTTHITLGGKASELKDGEIEIWITL
jgi:hypothetical protein